MRAIAQLKMVHSRWPFANKGAHRAQFILSKALTIAFLFSAASWAAPSQAIGDTIAKDVASQQKGTSHTHFNSQVQKLDGAGLVFAGAYSTALSLPGAPTKYNGWFEGAIQGQIDRDYFEFSPPKPVPNARYDVINDGAEFRWQDDYQACSKPGPEKGSDGGQMRPRVKGIVRRGSLAQPISSGEIWFQYEIWFELGLCEFGKTHKWTSQKTARIEDRTVRPHRGNHWTITLNHLGDTAKAKWMLRGYNGKLPDPTFAKPLAEGTWQRITVRTYDLGTGMPKVDAWHQDAAQTKADKIFDAELGNWSKDTTISGIMLMNNSSGHGGCAFPGHDLSVLWRHWIVSTSPIDLGENSIGGQAE